ncbi:beta-mannosidase [Pseudoroseicyclus aestuarii]|uniref:beta-mannosidase n=1 Tax=Pseudoroseicyclus aestuarii TaxID=1795041 RepID=A0A318SWG0_9RHOB|nr:glycoside hydrolase family 2 protein [Pseudoroseicyclus aestuarii]PYE84706.1 beta-mannosidase [Pseudoroseicyclus aestuarii]
MPATTRDLTGDAWTLSDADEDYSCPIALPGDGVTALQQAGLIPDPYWGRNEYDLRWICHRDWTVTRDLDLDETEVDLVLTGLDCAAQVLLNGQPVLEAANAFRTWRADLSGAAKVGSNRLEIRFRAPVEAANERQAAQPFYIPWHEGNCPLPNGNMLRKPQCDFGWDWNIALAPFGVTGGIVLEPRHVPQVKRLSVSQDWQGEAVTLHVTAHAENAEGQEALLRFAGQEVRATVTGGTASAAFHIETPELWWPNGLGPQVLHDLSVTVGEAEAHRRIGLRRMELVAEKDAAGTAFGIRVNGHPVFAKGANWIPADALAGRITDAATRDLLQSAADANMTMIRVWGGGRYEADSFYEACDELGLMVWQDFMFACHLYPSTPEFLSDVEQEVRENVARLHHHACLALWCGDNELIGALGWFPESTKDRDRYLVNYDRLNRAVERALKETDPGANWWPSSPSPGPMSFGDAWHDDSAGDMHFWSVWHEGRDFDHYRDVSPRFCSEFGFQSYPNMTTIRTFADPADFNVAAPVFESHQKNAGGNARIAETMFRYFRFPQKFEDFVWLSQIQQGIAIKTAVTHWRSLKPHCMGTLYWQLNDTWPVCSWSSLDYGGEWKLLHHMAKDFYAPLTVSAVPEGGAIRLVGINDHREAQEITVTARALGMSGETRALGQATATLGADAAEVLRIEAGALAEGEVLAFDWRSAGGEGRDIHAPEPWKSYDLRDPQAVLDVAEEGGVWWVEVTAHAAPAFFATVEADVPGRLTDAAGHIMPGETARIGFTPRDPGARPRFTLRDLYTATTAVPEGGKDF